MPHQIVIAVTGGGTQSLPTLFARPGASAMMLEAVVPYQPDALKQFIGAPVEQACSEMTARQLASSAFRRACELAGDDDSAVLNTVGVGCTAALATNRQRQGPDRAFVVVHGSKGTLCLTMNLGISTFTAQFGELRATQEQWTSDLILTAMDQWGVELHSITYSPVRSNPSMQISKNFSRAVPELQKLLQGATPVLRYEDSEWVPADSVAHQLILSGSFNPLHEGHLQMASAAEETFGAPVTLELCVQNADKPALDYLSIDERSRSLLQTDHAVLLTRLSRFDQKAKHFPQSTFIVGADTAIRIADPRFYGNDPARRDAAIDLIASQGCRFYVVGRLYQGSFLDSNQLPLPDSMRKICVFNSEFRNDISSTELRTQHRVQNNE